MSPVHTLDQLHHVYRQVSASEAIVVFTIEQYATYTIRPLRSIGIIVVISAGASSIRCIIIISSIGTGNVF